MILFSAILEDVTEIHATFSEFFFIQSGNRFFRLNNVSVSVSSMIFTHPSPVLDQLAFT